MKAKAVQAKTKHAPDKNLNLNVRGMGNSATVAINDRCNALCAEGRRVFKLGLGQSPFPVPEPVVEALRRSAHEKDYLPTQGLPAHRIRSGLFEECLRCLGSASIGLPFGSNVE